ncbi:nucleotidyl transferase AbiEii/AbiGii toxin family protein [Candidatus Parcubacteria bacterium]|nr:nucleotidyl transferase AbiEii/AbiGii toxin family protein [Candidatus Parcubacteria bacterium]
MHLEAITSKQKRIFDKLNNFPDYYLAGGTALALQIGHRISVDFDFFSKTDIPKKLLSKIKNVFYDIKVTDILNHSEQLTVDLEGINLTFVRYPFPLISKLKEYQGVKMLQVPEIAVTKSYTLGQRATYKDYVDLYFILNENFCTLSRIIKLAQKKYKENFDPRLFLEQLVYLEDVKDVEIKFLQKRATKKVLQNFFEHIIIQYKL